MAFKIVRRNEWTKKEEYFDDTVEMILIISRYNEYLSPAEVDKYLNEGKRIYTTFSSYIRVED